MNDNSYVKLFYKILAIRHFLKSRTTYRYYFSGLANLENIKNL